jgi:hypothetical protein
VILNAKGDIYYGIHFYPGVAQYQEEGKDPYRVFLNEDTLRVMDPTFAGRPIFVEHVDEVDQDLNQLRKEADGWVIESFFNSSDGKHWVKFVIVSEAGKRAVKQGMRLSNAYIPKSFKNGGLWNGVPYEREITDGEYEHLAIVNNPRYEESVIMTPDQFKQYNDQKVTELKKISNSKQGGNKMKWNLFKRSKVENSIDFSELRISLPKSKREVTIEKLINDAYESDEDPAMGNDESAKDHAMANMDHHVKMHDGSMMKVKDMMNKFKAMNDEMAEMKKKKDSSEKELDLKTEPSEVDAEGDLHNDEHEAEVSKEEKKAELHDDLEHPEKVVHDDEDEEAKKKALQLAEHEEKEIEQAKKKKNAQEKALRLKNAHLKEFQNEQRPVLELSHDRVARGKARYGSSN